MKVKEKFVLISAFVIIIVLIISNFWPPVLWSSILIIPLIILGIIDMIQTKHAIKRNFPVIGRMKYV